MSDDLYKRCTKDHIGFARSDPKVARAFELVFEDFSKMSTEELKELIAKTPPEYRDIIESLDRGEFKD